MNINNIIVMEYCKSFSMYPAVTLLYDTTILNNKYRILSQQTNLENIF